MLTKAFHLECTERLPLSRFHLKSKKLDEHCSEYQAVDELEQRDSRLSLASDMRRDPDAADMLDRVSKRDSRHMQSLPAGQPVQVEHNDEEQKSMVSTRVELATLALTTWVYQGQY